MVKEEIVSMIGGSIVLSSRHLLDKRIVNSNVSPAARPAGVLAGDGDEAMPGIGWRSDMGV